MSLLPYFADIDRPSRLFDQHFGLELSPDDFLPSYSSPLISRDYYRPWRHLVAAAKDLGSSVKCEKDKFEVNLDVQQFKPEEIKVKTVDGFIEVEGEHEEKEDEHGFISRRFVRRYALPEGCEPEKVISKLSSDGQLTVTAPRQATRALKDERVVPIVKTGEPQGKIEHKQENMEQ